MGECTPSLFGRLDNVGITWIGDGEDRYPVELTASSTKLDVIATVVVNTSLAKHSIILDLTLANCRAVVGDDDQFGLRVTGK